MYHSLVHDATGALGVWFMNGMQIAQSAGISVVPTSWTVQGLNAD
jgi:hypothetical protein